jgi:hypothetical protein
MDLYGVFWQRDGTLISDRDEYGKDFNTPAEAYMWACQNISWPEDGQDSTWYVEAMTIDASSYTD